MTASRQLQSPLLVGRDEMLTLAERRITDAKDGHGALVLLAGEAGIGKSRLLKAIVRQALLAGFRGSKGDLSPQDSLVPLACLNDLARTMDQKAFGDLGPRLLEIRGGKGADTLASRRILVRELAEAIIDAIDRPTVLAFEDLQWADELTLEVIGELGRHGQQKPLLVLADYRFDELPAGSIHREWRSRLLTQRVAEELRLERLTEQETALVTTLILATGLPASREVVDAVYERTNGIPLHIEELLGALGSDVSADGRLIRDAAVPDTIEDAVLARAARLSDDARAVARAGAVVGRCFAPEVLAGIMDRPVAALDDPLQELVDQAILFPYEMPDKGYYDFRHQLLRDALYDTVPASELRRLHARAGEFGAELIGASEVHASLHFERAGLRGQAFRAALGGARAAAAVSSRRESFELFRRAIANMPDDLSAAERVTIYRGYGDAAAAVDDMAAVEEAARRTRQNALEAGDAVAAAGALCLLLAVGRRDVRPRGDRLALAAEAEAELQALPRSPERASLLMELRFVQAMLAVDVGQHQEARARIAELREFLREAGEPEIDAEWIGAIPEVLDGSGDGTLTRVLDVARRARDANLEASCVTAYRWAAWMGIRLMDYATTAIGLEEGLRYADAVEQSFCRSIMAATSAHCAWAAGEWDDAVRIAELELVERTSRRAGITSRDALAYVALGRGYVDRARRLLDDGLAISRPGGELDLILPALWGHAEASLIAGEPGRAFSHCEEAVELTRETGERAYLVPFVVTGVRAALADRRPEVAERWLAQVSALLKAWTWLAAPAIAHAEGLVRFAAGTLVAARSSLEAAVEGWDAKGRIWEATWARVDLAGCLLRGGRYVDANRLIAEADATARRLASGPLTSRLEELSRQARGRGIEEQAWYPLTAREFEVAREIAAGKTNAEIATELFVSPKTVSAHVEHILAKLGAGRRAEIAAWATTVVAADTEVAAVRS